MRPMQHHTADTQNYNIFTLDQGQQDGLEVHVDFKLGAPLPVLPHVQDRLEAWSSSCTSPECFGSQAKTTLGCQKHEGGDASQREKTMAASKSKTKYVYKTIVGIHECKMILMDKLAKVLVEL